MATATSKPVAREKRVAPVKPKVAQTKATPAKKAAPKPVRRERRVTPAEVAKKVAAKKATAKPRPTVERKAPKAESTVAVQTKGKKKDTLEALAGSLYLLDELGHNAPRLIHDFFVKPNFPAKMMNPAMCEVVLIDKHFGSIIKGTGNPDLDGKHFKLEAGDLALAQRRKDGSYLLVSLSENVKPVAADFDAKAINRVKFEVVPTEDEDQFNTWITTKGGLLKAAGFPIDLAD